RVVLVEAHRERLAVEHLLLDLALDESLELVGVRRTAPLRLEGDRELGEIVERELDLPRRLGADRAAVQGVVRGEERGAEQQEVEQRLAQQASHAGSRRRSSLRRAHSVVCRYDDWSRLWTSPLPSVTRFAGPCGSTS